MPPRVTRHFITVGDRRVHYTRAGAGPVISILHASPCSSKVSRTLQEIYAERFTVFAFDTPGFGLSDPLPLPQPETEDLADAIAAALRAIGVERSAVHGRHTGAQIAVEVAARHPSLCSMAITDGFPIFDPAVAKSRPGSYLQPIVPEWDGGHLLWLWFRYREQHVFWPWNAPDLEHRADADVPDLDFIHRGVVELLEAGDGYRIGYATAYRHRGNAVLDDLKVPVVFGWRRGDSLWFMRDRLPAHARSVEVPRDYREAALAERALFAEHPAVCTVPPAPPCAPIPGRTTTDYVDVAGRQMLVRRAGESNSGAPVVILHKLPGSSFLYDALVAAIGRSRPVIALDLPGHGESEPLGHDEQAPATLARAAWAALDALGVTAADLYGHQGGAAVALEMAHAAPDRARRLVLDAPVALTPDERETIGARWLDQVLPVMPSWEGAHLVRLWHMRRDMELWWPWFDRTRARNRTTPPAIDPAALTVEVRETIKQPASFAPAWRAVMAYPFFERLASAPRPVRIVAAGNDAFAPCVSTIRARGLEVGDLPGEAPARAAAILAALEG